MLDIDDEDLLHHLLVNLSKRARSLVRPPSTYDKSCKRINRLFIVRRKCNAAWSPCLFRILVRPVKAGKLRRRYSTESLNFFDTSLDLRTADGQPPASSNFPVSARKKRPCKIAWPFCFSHFACAHGAGLECVFRMQRKA